MKIVRPVDFVFLISLGIFAGSCIIVQATGGVAPCGPASSWGVIWLVGYPIGAIGMVVGLVLSLISAFRKPRPKDNSDTNPK
jgi:predicted histidine transporter YuiF (NhaC family)